MSKDLRIKSFEVNPLGVNCYVVSDETKEAVIIDCGCFHLDEWNSIKNYIEDNELKISCLLNTHLHFDHVMGNPMAYNDYGVSPMAHNGDLPIYNKVEDQLNHFLGTNLGHIEMPALCKEMRDGDIITFGNHKLLVIHTPGHSMGSICFYCKEENTIFTGDTLFRMSIGRTDLEGGNYKEMTRSLERLKELPSNTIVYPGHGPKSIISDEKAYNPYLAN